MENLCLLTKSVEWIKGKLKLYGITFWSGIIVGFLAHGFVFTNKLMCHDEVGQLFAKGITVTSGRWFLPVISLIFPDFSMPWLYGIITVILFTVSACILVKLFDIKNPVLQGLTGALIVSFPALTGTFGFMFTSTSYGVSFLLMTVGVYLISNKLSYKTFIGIACMILSMGIYQAYVAFGASLAIVLLIMKALNDKKEEKSVIYEGIKSFLSLVISAALYFVIAKIVLVFSKSSFNDYANKALQGSESLKSKVISTYISYIKEIFSGQYGLVPTVFSRALHILCLIFVAVVILIWIFRKGNLLNKLVVIALLILYPFSVNCLVLITGSGTVHTLTMYSFTTLYVLVIALIEKIIKDKNVKFSHNLGSIVSLLLVGIVVSNVYIANETYLDYKLRYENLYSYFTQVVTQIKMQPEFKKDTKVAIIGNGQDIPEFYRKFDSINVISGVSELTPNMYTRNKFLEYYIGFNGNYATDIETEKISKTDEFKQMPIYPDSGSIKCIDNCVVVKLGD